MLMKPNAITYLRAMGSAGPRGSGAVIPDREWFTVDILVEGEHVTVKFNGKTLVDFVDKENSFLTGSIALTHPSRSTFEVRKVEIRDLNAAKPPPVVAADGFVPLFNGKDLTGWKKLIREGDWSVANGTLSSGRRHCFLATERDDYHDFHLRAEVRIREGAAGVCCRAGSDEKKLSFGFSVLVNDNTNSVNRTGAIFGIFPQKEVVRSKNSAPGGEWLLLEVIAKGDDLTIKINGKTEATHKDTEKRFAKSGFIAINPPSKPIEFRKIEIKELKPDVAPPVGATPGFTPLFNGKSVIGDWKVHAKQIGAWAVKEGILTSLKTSGAFYTQRSDYKDFHLRVEARINDGGVCGVFGRAPFGPMTPPGNPTSPIGYQTLINSTNKKLNLTGSLFVTGGSQMSGAAKQLAAPGEWFTLELLVEGSKLTAKVNGKTVTSFSDSKNQFESGCIALYPHTPQTVVEFRKIEIKELPAP